MEKIPSKEKKKIAAELFKIIDGPIKKTVYTQQIFCEEDDEDIYKWGFHVLVPTNDGKIECLDWYICKLNDDKLFEFSDVPAVPVTGYGFSQADEIISRLRHILEKYGYNIEFDHKSIVGTDYSI